jgi:hypothetical protein
MSNLHHAVEALGFRLLVMCSPDELSNSMKTVQEPCLKADPVITEVRRAKVALAVRYNFDVNVMVRGQRELDQQDKANKARLNNPRPTVSPDEPCDQGLQTCFGVALQAAR